MHYKYSVINQFCLFFATLVFAPFLQAAQIIELRVTGGEFHMGTFTPSGAVPFSFSDSTYNLITDFPTPIGWDVLVSQVSDAPGAIVAFPFGAPFVNAFNVECDPLNVDDCINFPHTATTGTVSGANAIIADGDPIVVDINGLYANWNGVDFNQGGTTGNGTAYPGQPFEFDYTSTVSNVNVDTFNYSMTWQSLIIGGPFNGQTGTWTFTGTGVVATISNDPKTDPGLVLSPNNFGTIMITANELQNGGFPLPGSDDDCSSGCWDWILTGLANPGDSANVVLPLFAPITAETQISKFNTATNTWVPFDDSGVDSISTAALAGGTCPDTGDAAYQPGLVVGFICLQLTMADGGDNDDDGLQNLIIVDPGATITVAGGGGPVGPQTTKINDNSASCSMSTFQVDPKKRSDWWLLAGFLAWLSWKQRNRKLH